MEPDISNLFNSISLTEAESPPVVFPEGNSSTNEDDTGFYMVGKVLNPRPVNPETVAKQMRRAFNPLKEMSVKLLGDNKFLFRFQSFGDFSKVEEGRPWHFENHLFVMSTVPPEGYAGSVTLVQCPFTVQIHNLPFLSFPRGAAEALGNRIGQFLNAELDAQGSSQVAALRIRVALDIRKLLIRALKVPAQDGSMVHAAITYEKLPIFFSECGMLDHQVRYCVKAREKSPTDRTSPTYGPWLRATKPRILEPNAKKDKPDSGTAASSTTPTVPREISPGSPVAINGVSAEQEDINPVEIPESDILRGEHLLETGEMQVEDIISMELINLALEHPSQATTDSTSEVPIQSITEPMDISSISRQKKRSRDISEESDPGELVTKFSPILIFLSETKCGNRKLQWLKDGFSYFGICIDAIGASGGTALFWHKDITVNVLSYSKRYIDAMIVPNDATTPWCFTGFYGQPVTNQRPEAWETLQRLSIQRSQPWLVAGDFNEVCYPSEFSSRTCRPQPQMALFRSTLNDCGLLDIKFEGFPYTWSNNRAYPDTVRARLDRAVSSFSWWQLFPNAVVHHLPFGGSDHAPIMILCDNRDTTRAERTKQRFKFEARWLELPDCEETVRNGWHRLSPNQVPLYRRLSTTRLSLIRWNRQGIHQLKASIREIEVELETLLSRNITQNSKERETELRRTLFSLLAQEETYWKQKSKKHWFVNRDRNTAFFHAAASSRRAMNKISNLRDETGTLLDSEASLQQGFINYFSRLFTSENPDAATISEVVSNVTPKLSPNMIVSLNVPFSE
ncbi:hypothetical protein M569_03261 [Genlisea aurea]|uniref:DUF4283 domain-containing protein n=1 Tax=Genlisea aurea TaxID=192259 RepID=S8D293_9LAMI|nr:hypothetical protein M569_03261 [Genlisea aurea]